MTARPLRQPRQQTGLRVVAGRRAPRVVMTPWLVFSVFVVAALLGMVATRTAMDAGAFELAEITTQIDAELTTNQQLRLEIARLESPARIGPLAEEMGMVYPGQRHTLLVEGVIPDGEPGDTRWASIDTYALDSAADVTP